MALMRLAFEFVVPIIVAAVAIGVLVGGDPPPVVPATTMEDTTVEDTTAS